MSILGIGVDLVHVPRIAALLNRRNPARFASRILSPQERPQWHSLSKASTAERLRFLAVRWGVKEAAYKAMYPTVKPTWKELTYHGLDRGKKPRLIYYPIYEQEKEKIGKIHVSVSHDGEYVYTSVIIEEPLPVSK